MGDDRPTACPAAGRLETDSTARSRRSLCRGVAVLGLPLAAGCSTLSGMLAGNPGEVTVFNDTDATVTATLAVTNLSEGTTALSESTTIESSGAATFDRIFESAAEYRFEIETAAGLAASYEWDLPSTDHYLYITVRSESIDFAEQRP